MVLGFSTLPDEVLLHVRECVVPSVPIRSVVSVARLEESYLLEWSGSAGVHHPLHALSQTCRRIRGICALSMFFRITLSEYSRIPPPSVTRYTRLLRVTLAGTGGADADYKDVLRSMPELITIFWQPRGSAPTTSQLLRILMSPPTLSTFMTQNVSFLLLSPGGSVTSHLRELDISQRSRDLFSMPASDILSEKTVLEGIIIPLTPTLEILRLPGESARFSFLAEHTWPSLCELTIRGGAPQVDTSFSDAVSVMPRLRVLTVAVARRGAPAIVLLPTTPRSDTTLGLRRLTVSDPHPDEAIFSYLDHTLSELSLRDVPRYYDRRHRPTLHDPALLPCRQAIQILCSLPLRGSSLTRLEISAREDGAGLELLALIATSCHNLIVLELHNYRNDDIDLVQPRQEEVEPVLAPIATILVPLRGLRVLRLNFDLGLPTQDDWNPTNPRKWSPVFDAQAQAIANVLPWLVSISFLTTHMLGPASWSVWDLVDAPAGGVAVKHDPLGDDSTLDHIRF